MFLLTGIVGFPIGMLCFFLSKGLAVVGLGSNLDSTNFLAVILITGLEFLSPYLPGELP